VGSDNRLVVVMTVAVVGFFGGLVRDSRLGGARLGSQPSLAWHRGDAFASETNPIRTNPGFNPSRRGA
jgi:hypothetical protein